MTRKLTLPLALVFALGATACDDDGGVQTDAMVQISGSWQAQSFTYVAQADPNTSINLMEHGTTVALNITRTSATTGTFTGTAVIPLLGVMEPTPIGGALTITSTNQLHVDFNEATNQLFDDLNVSYSVQANTFTWTTSEVTFPGTEGTVPATLTVVLVRVTS